MPVAWLQRLQQPGLVSLWLLPSLLLPGSWGGGAHHLLPGRPPLLFQPQPAQSPGGQIQLHPAAALRSEPRQSQRGAGVRPAGHGVIKPLIPHSLQSVLQSTSDPKQCTTTGNTVLFSFFFWHMRWPQLRAETRWRTPWCCFVATVGEGPEIIRHRFPSCLAIKHHYLHSLQLACAHWRAQATTSLCCF